MNEKVEAWMARMVSLGLYYRNDQSQWASHVLPVPKPNGDTRFCGNYIAVNEQCRFWIEPMPNPREKMTALKGCELFGVCDIDNGFYQGPLDKASQDIF